MRSERAHAKSAAGPGLRRVAAPRLRPADKEPGCHVTARLRSAEREAARLLIIIRDRSLYRHLEFVRLGDYAIEKLGVTGRTVNDWIRTEETLVRLPLAEAAFDAGEITECHVRLLGRIVTPETEPFWVRLARRTTVRRFSEMVAAAADGAAGAAASRPDAPQAVDLPQPASGESEAAHVFHDQAADSHGAAPGDEPDGERLDLLASAWVSRLWRDTVALVRKLCGREETQGRCFEIVMAEYLSVAASAGNERRDGARSQADADDDRALGNVRPSSGPAAGDWLSRELRAFSDPRRDWTRTEDGDGARGESAGAESTAAQASGAGSQGELHAFSEVALGSAEVAEDDGARSESEVADSKVSQKAGGWSHCELHAFSDPRRDWTRPGVGDGALNEGEVTDPGGDSGEQADGDSLDQPAVSPGRLARRLDRRLRHLMTVRQRCELALADALHDIRETRAFRHEGFRSLEAYAEARFGLRERRLYYLLRLRRSLDGLPALRRSFIAGHVTLRQALLIGKSATPSTVRAWLKRAGEVTLRRLEDEASYLEHLRDVRPAVWLKLGGAPLPDGIVLLPGLPPRLHAFSGSGIRWDGNQGSNPGLHATSDQVMIDLDGDGAQPGNQTGSREPSRLGCGLNTDATVAARFLAALEAEEASIPMPGHPCRIRMTVEAGVTALWEAAFSQCRAALGSHATEGDVFAAILCHFWMTHENSETKAQRREHPVLERDGWRCAAPGCRSVGTGALHEHHIVFRSQGGNDMLSNIVALCTGHHVGQLHRGLMRVTGEAPDALIWEMGIEPGLPPLGRYHGDRRVESCR